MTKFIPKYTLQPRPLRRAIYLDPSTLIGRPLRRAADVGPGSFLDNGHSASRQYVMFAKGIFTTQTCLLIGSTAL